MDEQKGLTREARPALTLEAQQAIRAYLWKYIGPSSVVLALVSGILGFYIRDIAIRQATQDAFAAVQHVTMDMAQKTIDAKTRADAAVRDVEKAQETAKLRADTVDTQMRALEERERLLASTMTGLENLAREQAAILASSPEHVSKIAGCLAEDPRVVEVVQDYISAKESQFQKIDSALKKIETIKILQIECKKGTIRSGDEKTKFTFKFPVKEFWMELASSGQGPLTLTEKIEGNTVTLSPIARDSGGPTVLTEEDVDCRICATGY